MSPGSPEEPEQATGPTASGGASSHTASIQQAIGRVSEFAAHALGVERVGVWLFEDGRDVLRRVHLYVRTAGVHVSGGVLPADRYPAYFAALRDRGRLVVVDVAEEESARELLEPYARPLDIQAWIDQPVETADGPSGIVRFEKVGSTRDWTVTDLRLAETAANLLSMILGTEPGAETEGETERDDREDGPEHDEVSSAAEEPAAAREEPAPAAEEPAPEDDQPVPEDDQPAPQDGFGELRRRGEIGMVRMDADGVIQEANRAFARIVDLERPAEVRGRSIHEFLAHDEAKGVLDRLRSRGEITVEEIPLTAADGSKIWTLMNAVRTEEGAVRPHFLAVFMDITARKAQEEELQRQAHKDALTGLANRRLLWEKATQALALADRHSREAAVLYLDLTNFKKVNDEHGHRVGDQVLVAVARRLQESLRESDVAARIGGDEFAVLLAEVEGTKGALEAARRIQEGLDRPVQVEGVTLDVQARAGVAVYPTHGLGLEDLLDKADQAMYAAREKEAKDAVEVFRPEPAVASEAPAEPAPRSTASDWVADLEAALKKNELTLHYQPIFGLPGGDFTGAEALLRWEHPGRGLLSPDEFLTDALRAGLWAKIDRWVLRRAITQAAEWQASGGPSWVSVNLSPTSLRDPGLVYFIHCELERTDLDPSRLLVEVAEGSVREEGFAATRTLGALRELGVRIAIDRCGTSPSVRTSLRYLPADLVKVDLGFVQRAEYDLDDPELARVLSDLAGRSGASMLAGGVETAGEFEWARAAIFNLAQGFYMARPVPPEEVSSLSAGVEEAGDEDDGDGDRPAGPDEFSGPSGSAPPTPEQGEA